MKNALGANEILQMIFTYMTEVSALREHDDIIFVLANMGKALTNADRCTVWVVDDQEIWTKVAHGMDAIRLPKDSGIVGNSITSGKKIIIDDVYKDDRFNPNIDKKTLYRTRSMMVIPMFDNDDEIIGAFQVINNLGEDGVFDKRDMERLMLASTYAAETLIAASLTKEIEETQKEVVFTMGAIGESRSKETGNHVKRVAEYSKILALAYGMSKEEAELLKQASPMHDIGKVAIPDAILNKPGRFNDEERAIMDTHAELGYAMIKDSKRPLLKAASIVAYEHHEKYNGKGYPNKTKGEDIHIYGRITALADVFDALGSDRVYKKAWDDERIFKLFKEERGEHFDPKLIDLFFENLDEILAVRQEYKDIYQKSEPKEIDPNEIQILGAYGTKAKGFGTSSFLLNKQNVLDAGNILATLNEESIHLETIWITHSHLDHISDIAFILDNFFSLRSKTLTLRALPATIEALKKHFFNELIWPDFSKINLVNSELKALAYEEIELGVEYSLGEGDSIRAFKTDHTVPSCGYIFTRDKNSVLITADTYSLENVIKIIESEKNINAIVIECSFPSSMPKLAKESKHLTPTLLFESIQKIKREDIRLYINHIKPSYIDKIVKEIKEYKGKMTPIILKDEDFINFGSFF
ncbi:MAG: HD domain-containing protein [Sulfurimonas sp.]|uniref:HD domain-containing phosphohydrolase n=1 Tax=Sulfurimonas sp. TaxID=2022749 RepID=UPI0025CBAD67|nr:HD domain-containing phosphohydrolase [Sulfurimonas sp.]MCK9492495.1 HD domain-containing protein [Sulfurimonas sp.]